MSGRDLGRRLRERDRSAAAPALNLIETRTADARRETAALFAEVSPAALGGEAPAHVIGITGPPGAGKSTLLSALVKEWRSRGRTVAVLAVDPSSKRSGGALLGDRARIEYDPRDDGVGQSETDVADLCDTVAVVVQPGSGDVLQFLKAGIMEVPDVLVVTKADLEQIARRAQRDLAAALRAVGARDTPVVAVSSVPPPSGIGDLADALDAHGASADVTASRVRARRLAALAEFTLEHGESAVRDRGGRREVEKLLAEQDPGLPVSELVKRLEA